MTWTAVSWVEGKLAIVELVTEGHDPPLEASVGISAVVTLLADWGSPVEDSVRFIWDHL